MAFAFAGEKPAWQIWPVAKRQTEKDDFSEDDDSSGQREFQASKGEMI